MRIVVAGLLCLVRALPAAAQSPERLPVQGSATYVGYWHSTALAEDGFRVGGLRFAGRVALRLRERLYAGVSVGSWEREVGVSRGDSVLPDRVANLATAVVGSLYTQGYPLRTVPLFLRAGAGVGRTKTYYPIPLDPALGSTLLVQRATRFAPTVGLGVDVPLRPLFAMTVSVDYTMLRGVTAGRELKSGLAVGLGLTLR